MEVVLEALKLYRARREFKVGELLKFARICRIERIITPYLEASRLRFNGPGINFDGRMIDWQNNYFFSHPESNALAFVIIAGEMPPGAKRFSICSLFRGRNGIATVNRRTPVFYLTPL